MIERTAILGVGLIGGSLALAWQKHRPDMLIVGYDRPEVLEEAQQTGVIDESAVTLEAAVAQADLVVLAAPIGANLQFLETMAPHLKPGAVVTDVGSVKAPVVEQAWQVLQPQTPFVAGHPMAGSEHSGIANANSFLFENATYVLCPPEGFTTETFTHTFDTLIDLVEVTGARVLLLDAERHDRIAAVVSHLPQLLAVLLTNFAARHHAEDPAFLKLAAGGFRDLTRIASSPFPVWRDILVANTGPLLDTLGAFSVSLQKMRNRLAEEDLNALNLLFGEARHVRNSIPKDSKGFLNPLFDVYVYVEDEPGALYGITRLLHEKQINIKDIELLKIREGTGGTFRLGFSDRPGASAAVDAFHAAGFQAYML